MLRVHQAQHRDGSGHAGRASAGDGVRVRKRLAVFVQEHVGRCARRGGLASVECRDRAGLRVVIEQEGAATEARTLRLDQPQCGLHGDRGIGGTATGAQHLEPGLDRDRIRGRDARREPDARCGCRVRGGRCACRGRVRRGRRIATSGCGHCDQGEQDNGRDRARKRSSLGMVGRWAWTMRGRPTIDCPASTRRDCPCATHRSRFAPCSPPWLAAGGWALPGRPTAPCRVRDSGSTAVAPQDIVVVHAGRLLDRPGKAPRGPSTIVIRDGRISEVRDGFVDVPGSQRGRRPAHAIRAAGPDRQPRAPGHRTPAGRWASSRTCSSTDAALAYNALVNAHKTLRAGFTTVRNLGDEHGVTLALRDAIRAGKVVGPNIVDAGRSMSTTSGHMDAALGYREDLRDRAARARQPVRQRRVLPPRRAHPGGSRRGRDQDRHDRRRQQPGRRGARPADVRRRSACDRRDREAVRQEGRRACARRRRHQGRAHGGRRFDRARHDARRRVHRADGEVGHLLRADAVHRERLHRAPGHEPARPIRRRCGRRSSGASG